MQSKSADLERLLEISRLLAVGTDLMEILRMIIEQAAAVMDAEWASVLLYDPTTEELYVETSLDGFELRFPVSKGIAGAAANSAEAVMVNDAYSDDRFYHSAEEGKGTRTRNLIACRMVDVDGRLTGVLEVLNKRTGDFTERDRYLVTVLSAQAAVAIQRARLITTTLETTRTKEQLAIGRKIQQSLLPDILPKIPGYASHAVFLPAEHVAGDLYDLFPIRDGAWGIMIGDATGHGVGAALIGAEGRALIRGLVAAQEDLGRVIRQANDILVSNLPEEKFITVFLGVLDPAYHRLCYISAGQAPLLLFRAGDRRVETLNATGIPLGMITSFPYSDPKEILFEPGDILTLFTDGLFEMRSPEQRQLELGLVEEWLKSVGQRPLDEAARELLKIVQMFAHGEPQEDDITGLLLRRTCSIA